jgi:hypothetical protein
LHVTTIWKPVSVTAFVSAVFGQCRNLFLLDGERHALQSRILSFDDRGVETIVVLNPVSLRLQGGAERRQENRRADSWDDDSFRRP